MRFFSAAEIEAIKTGAVVETEDESQVSVVPVGAAETGVAPAADPAASARMAATLSSGRSSARWSIPSAPAMAAAVRALSPVSITAPMPSAFSSAMAAAASGRASSRSATRPSGAAPEATTATVLPAASSAEIRRETAACDSPSA